MASILVVDDDREVRETISSLITRLGHEPFQAEDLSQAREILLTQRHDLVLLDIRLPDGNGLDLLPEVAESPGQPEVIILTGLGDPDGAELAIRRGAWDYLVKPVSIKDISLSLKQVLKYRGEKQEKGGAVALNLEGVVGKSDAFRTLHDKLAIASTLDAGVLVTGETGTGKELLARTIHKNSPRASGSFVAVDCASLTETLVESILFGHRKGAFTGATTEQTGLIKLADKGTLFLDEVGEMPLSIQRSFLRVLQERTFRPVGGPQELTSDFRVISATNQDLDQMVKEGKFREDLLFRLRAVHLKLPPLRDRLLDIKPLAMHRITELSERYGTPQKGFDNDFIDVLMAYHWPGNVRELFNVLERSFVAAANDPSLYVQHLPKELRIAFTQRQIEQKRGTNDCVDVSQAGDELLMSLPQEGIPTIKEFKSIAERKYLEQLIERSGGDVSMMLETSGLSRSHFYAVLKRHGLST